MNLYSPPCMIHIKKKQHTSHVGTIQICVRSSYTTDKLHFQLPAGVHKVLPGLEGFPAGCFSSLGQSAPEEALKPPQCVHTVLHSGAASPSHGSAKEKENVRRGALMVI